MSIPEALKGARQELAALPSPVDKLRRITAYARIIGAELLGTLAIAPYGLRAAALHRSLPEPQPGLLSAAKGLRYGPLPRNALDVYLPPDAPHSLAPDGAAAADQPDPDPAKPQGAGLPVVLFCHGGIWATGERWHYAPLATRLAQAGIVTAVMSYSLYPSALAPQMAEEVSRALTWTLDAAAALGGDPGNVTLVGHSAGAQLCAMALLHRAAEGGDDFKRSKTGGGDGGPYSDGRMPRRLVGMAGVFDIARHFEYEEARDVHTMSTMARAVGGAGAFAAASPAVILRAAAAGGRPSADPHGPSEAVSDDGAPLADFADELTLNGDLIAARIGLNRFGNGGGAVAPAQPPLRLSLAQARRLPPVVLQSSVSDVTVPWYESADMHWACHDAGVPAASLVYNRAGHGDFVVNWRPVATPGGVAGTADLPPYGADLVRIVRGEAAPRYGRRRLGRR